MLDARTRLLQRIANRLGAPLGILPFPFSHDFQPTGAAHPREVFEEIYQQKYWTRGDSGSGAGSELRSTATYRRALLAFLCSRQICSMFDAPCGDLNWMRYVIAEWPMKYIGGDISPSAVQLAKQKAPDADIRLFDICKDIFPDCQVWQCRDALFHLSFDDIWNALENAARSNISYALITTHRARWLRNVNIVTGSWRYLDLERKPFNFPRAQAYLRDYGWGDFPRFVGVWTAEDLRKVVGSRPRPHSS